MKKNLMLISSSFADSYNSYYNYMKVINHTFIVGTPPLLKGGINIFHNSHSWGERGGVGKFLLERGKGLIYNRGRVLLFVTYFDFFLYCVNVYGN